MSSKSTPLARGVRTFAASMVGVLGAAVVADWVSAFNASATTFTLGTIAALIAGVAAYLLAVGGITTASTALGKAIATTAQYIGSGLATIAVADLTTNAIKAFGTSLLRVVIAGVAAGLVTLAVNGAEDHSVAVPPQG